jgi:ribosomal protein S9
MPITKLSVASSIKTATMIVMTSPSIIIPITAISIRAVIAGGTARQGSAVARPITRAIVRADCAIRTTIRAVISVPILVIVPARRTVFASAGSA